MPLLQLRRAVPQQSIWLDLASQRPPWLSPWPWLSAVPATWASAAASQQPPGYLLPGRQNPPRPQERQPSCVPLAHLRAAGAAYAVAFGGPPSALPHQSRYLSRSRCCSPSQRVCISLSFANRPGHDECVEAVLQLQPAHSHCPYRSQFAPLELVTRESRGAFAMRPPASFVLERPFFAVLQSQRVPRQAHLLPPCSSCRESFCPRSPQMLSWALLAAMAASIQPSAAAAAAAAAVTRCRPEPQLLRSPFAESRPNLAPGTPRGRRARAPIALELVPQLSPWLAQVSACF